MAPLRRRCVLTPLGKIVENVYRKLGFTAGGYDRILKRKRTTRGSNVDNPRRLNSCTPEKRPCTPKDGVLTPGFAYSITPIPKFLDRSGMENRVRFSYASMLLGRLERCVEYNYGWTV